MKTSIVKVQLSLLLPAYLPWLHTWKYYFEKSRKPRFKSDIIRHLKSKDHCLPSSCLFLHYQQCEYGPNRPAKRNNPLSHRNFHRELCVNEYRIAHLQSPSQGQHLFFSKTIFPAIPALFPVPIYRPTPMPPTTIFPPQKTGTQMPAQHPDTGLKPSIL